VQHYVCVTVICCYSTVQYRTALCVCYCNVLLQYSVSKGLCVCYCNVLLQYSTVQYSVMCVLLKCVATVQCEYRVMCVLLHCVATVQYSTVEYSTALCVCYCNVLLQ
jgi:hypothetical protein